MLERKNVNGPLQILTEISTRKLEEIAHLLNLVYF